MKQQILSILPGDHPWQNHLICYDQVGSTNDLAKTMAAQGAAEGTVVIARSQTAGKGRLGRSFHAPEGLGLYLSVILRPNCTPDKLMHLTCAAALSACNAVESCVGLRPQIKWTNDLVAGTQKLGGILTEISINSKSGLVDWVIVGIGINCLHQEKDFPTELQNIATSLLLCTKKSVDPGQLAGHMISALYQMRQDLISQKDQILSAYSRDCLTIGKQILLVRGDENRYGTAIDVADDGGLIVCFEDGKTETVQSGEVSVRGLYGYV